jgi:hypothetical protein
MTISKMPPPKIAQTIDVLRWTMSGDDADAATETRRRARLCGPDAVAFLSFVMRSDRSPAAPSVCVRRPCCWKRAGSYRLKPKQPACFAMTTPMV